MCFLNNHIAQVTSHITIVKENLDFEEKKMVIYQCNLWVVDDFKYLKKKIHLTKLVFATNELKNQIPYFCIIYFHDPSLGKSSTNRAWPLQVGQVLSLSYTHLLIH
jgi:hypothetical protein